LSDSSIHRIVGLGLATVFLAFLTLVIMFAVFRDESVTFDTIFGAVCAYLLLGVTWGTAYALLVVISPDSLSVSAGLAHASGWGEPISAFTPVLQYYSFTTLATLGDRKSTRLNSSHDQISYAVFCLKKKNKHTT